MSFLNRILGKLGIGEAAAAEPQATAAAAASPSASTVATAAPAAQATNPPVPSAAPAPAAASTSMPMVDVLAKLEAMAAANPQKLNWRTSIVDLLKLLDIDSSLAARKELATELGCPAELMGDSAQMNMWLHKTVLRRIADNGGNVPKDLLD